jgi:signal peptidase I
VRTGPLSLTAKVGSPRPNGAPRRLFAIPVVLLCLASLCGTASAATQNAEKPKNDRPLPAEKEFMPLVIQKVLDWEKDPPEPEYREHRVTTNFDGDKVKDKLDEIYRVTWYRHKAVYVLEQKNGAPYPESSLQAQAERKKKAIDEEIANPPKKEKIDAIYLTPLLNRYTYKIVAREPLWGRTAIKIRFDPIPGKFPERKIASKILENITGHAWVDEETKELMKAEVTNPDTIRIGWGILANVTYLRIDYERKPQPNGVWYVSLLKVRAKVRVFFFTGYNLLSESTFNDLVFPSKN